MSYKIGIIGIGVVLLSACSKAPPDYHTTMLNERKGGPWQLVTYADKPIQHTGVIFENGRIYSSQRSVYVNAKSQFVYKDGSAINTYNGETIYWTSEGLTVTEDGRVVSDREVFAVDGKPMPDRTPMLIKEKLITAKADL